MTVVETDGRRARRERGRRAVVDAMVDLIQEGVVPPTAELIAERAGVSVASVFRYFESLADLQEVAMRGCFDRYAELFEVPSLGEGTLAARVDGLVRARLRLYETIEPAARLMRARAFDQPTLAGGLAAVRTRFADQVRRHLAPELAGLAPGDADDVVGVVSTVTSFESWDQLHHGLGRTDAQIARAWSTALLAMCGGSRP